ncbi:ABC transporter ATP-binding protein [Gottfriedia sp. NPDC058432]|uniref:ABC transporter ATP-binding protein n=1 Tax=Gottfriedia sp. NPDC058432 TaxID=3346497 RepID=UPI003666DCD5
MGDTLNKLLLLFNKREKKKLLVLFLMMIVSAMFETVGIGLIVPFVGIVTNPSIIKEQKILNTIYELFQFKSTTSFLIFSVFVLLLIFVLKNLYILLFQYSQNRVILNQQVKLSKRLFNGYLTKPYTFHLQRNTAVLLRNVNEEVPKVFQGIILSGFQLFTELLVIFCILSLLLYTTPVATLTASFLLGGSVILFLKMFRKKMSEIGKEQQQVNGQMIKWMNQGLGASKEVKVSGKENFFVNAYAEQSQKNAIIKRYIMMLDQVPRLFIETLIVSIVLITMLIIIFQGITMTKIVSTMALFAMAAFRLMPSINRVISMISTIRYNRPALTVIYEDLFVNSEELSQNFTEDHSLDLSINEEGTFKDSIRLNGVFFKYPNQQDYSIKDVSLTIPIGQSVAFIGESGAGKTTLVDIILGLFRPEKGTISVDDKDFHEIESTWKKKIGYIPQSIFLTDDTIRGNIAFGMPNSHIDDRAVWKALEQAQLKAFVESLPEKLDTPVGERGVRLSGGQRQRIGIARALYHNPEIIFMDEATSALDNETEKEIMSEINKLKGEKTLIIIAHRLTTIENCDVVYKISNGKLVSVNELKMSVI